MSAQCVPIEVFLSYAPEDEPLCVELEKHLSQLQRDGLIAVFHKRKIVAGQDWTKTLDEYLCTASIILLLVSVDFIASDYCYSVEMRRAMERHATGEAHVIPLLLRPVDWQSAPIGSLQALPSNGVPVTGWSDMHAAFTNIAQGIRSVVQDDKLPPAIVPPPMPRVWNIPYPRNPFFTGRDELLVCISTVQKSSQVAAISQPQAISGLGGIGKTQVAVEYAHQHRDDYQFVFWTLADTRESLVSGYITIAKLLNLPEKDAKEQQVIIEAVKHWLQTHHSWLLILDNADEPDQLRSFLPSLPGGHLLVTTRANDLSHLGLGFAHSLVVETFSPEQGARFLLHRAGLLALSDDLSQASAEDHKLAVQISQELGGLPLALDQAGAYIKATSSDLARYQRIYEHHRSQLFRKRYGVDHPEGVSTTWSLSFDKVEERNSMAADLLRLCAFLHPDAIPVELITKGAEYLGPFFADVSKDPIALDEAIVTLGAYSLIRRDTKDETLSVHRLVQAVLRDTMDEEVKKQWTERTVRAVNKVFPDIEFATWSQCERYLSHALVCADLIEKYHLISSEAACLLNQTGFYLKERARYAEAEPLLQHALLMCEQQRGPEHLDTATSLNRLALVYDAQGRYARAEPLYQQSLAINEQQLGPEHLATANSLNNLAALYVRQGKYIQAEPLYERALSIRERRLGQEHRKTANSLNNLAELYGKQRKDEQAELFYKQSLAIRERQLGLHHPYIAASLNNLAVLYTRQSKYVEAERLLQRALAIREQQLGPHHPETAISLNSLAALSLAQGQYEQCEALYHRALLIFEQHLGTDHPDTAYPLHGLAVLSQHQGRYEQAEAFYQRALTIRRQRLGPTHPDTQETRRAYTALLRLVGHDAEAMVLDKDQELPVEEGH